MRLKTSVGQVCGLMSLSLAGPMRMHITAALSPPRSEPANNDDFRLGALLAHPGFEFDHQGCALLPASFQTLIGRSSTDRALDVERGVDLPVSFERHRRGLKLRVALRQGMLLELAEPQNLSAGMSQRSTGVISQGSRLGASSGFKPE